VETGYRERRIGESVLSCCLAENWTEEGELQCGCPHIIFDNRKKQQIYIVLKLVYIDLTFKILTKLPTFSGPLNQEYRICLVGLVISLNILHTSRISSK
jgi:hypothetical protein